LITGELKNKVSRVWDAFWSGGISNPLEVIEQITYLLFIRRLDDMDALAEKKERVTGKSERLTFGRDEQDMRWSRFKNDEPAVMYKIVADRIFPFLRNLGSDGSTYSEHMKDARFTIPTAQLLSRVVDMLDDIPMADRDTNGDLYEYLLSKIASAGVNGQFRTPRHIIKLMVDMVAPQPTDELCDPACGTAGFLVAAAEYVRNQHSSVLTNAVQRKNYHTSMFHGYDFDATMLRIASMNMLMHGIESPDIRYRDSLSEGVTEDGEKYTLILANPPFAGSLDYESTSKDLQRVVKTKKTELLFFALFLKLLKPGGRAAVIVPDGILFGSSTAHKELRRILVEDQKLDGVVKLPSGVFRPYAGVSTAILIFTKTNSGGTEDVWFYDVRADGFSLDDKRNPVDSNDLPDVLSRWAARGTSELARARSDQSFCVPKDDIVGQGYDLSLNRYQELVHDDIEHQPPLEIVADIERLETEIAGDLSGLKAILAGGIR
jgi:type I restriction enzyme M protein